MGFPDSSVGKESAYNARDHGSIPGPGRSPGEGIGYTLQYSWASLVAQLVKNLPAVQETWFGMIPWRREWLPSPLFWSGEFYELYSPWGRKESDTTERLSLSLQLLCGLDLACGHPWQGLWDSVGHSPQIGRAHV